MTYYYRIRAFVDGIKEEAACSAVDTADALDAFKRLPAPDTRCAFEEYPIEIAMVHRVAFGESGPVFEDASHEIPSNWNRAGFHDALKFYKPTTEVLP